MRLIEKQTRFPLAGSQLQMGAIFSAIVIGPGFFSQTVVFLSAGILFLLHYLWHRSGLSLSAMICVWIAAVMAAIMRLFPGLIPFWSIDYSRIGVGIGAFLAMLQGFLIFRRRHDGAGVHFFVASIILAGAAGAQIPGIPEESRRLIFFGGMFLAVHTQWILFGLWVQRTRRSIHRDSAVGPVTDSSVEVEFLSNAAKSIRKPLNNIIGLSDSLLVRGEGADRDSQQSLSLLLSEGLKLSSQIDTVEDFIRIHHSQIHLHTQKIDPYRVLEGVIAQLQTLFLDSSVSIENRLPDTMTEIQGDQKRIQQLFSNWVIFCFHIMESGRIELISEDNESFLVIVFVLKEVSAEKADQLARVFLDKELPIREAFPDFWIGPELAVQLIHHMGGRFEMSRDPDVRFSFSLSRGGHLYESSEGDPAEIEGLERDRLLESQVLEDSENSVLVVGRDMTDLKILRDYLSDLSVSFYPFESGDAVFEDLKETDIQLALVDYRGVGMDSVSFVKRLREMTQEDLPVLLIADREDWSELFHLYTEDISDILIRPYNRESFCRRVQDFLHRVQLGRLYRSFVPNEFLRSLGVSDFSQVRLGDQVHKEMTVLFVDIRQFTHLSEGMTPQENFKFINSYLSRLTPFIKKHNGFVDKFIGDAIMALFPGSPDDAINTALDMVKYMNVYNGHRANCGYPPIRVGVGIHTGDLILGIIGDSSRMEGTVISDAVNLASRIQDVTKLYGADVVISQDTFVRLDDPTAYNFRFLGKVRVKGKTQSASLFEIFDGDPEEIRQLKIETKPEFESGILNFAKKNFVEALPVFRSVVGRNGEDQAARLFLDRTERYLAVQGFDFGLKEP